MNIAEAMVYAAAFAKVYDDNVHDGHEIAAARAVNAAKECVEGLRNAKQLAELAHRNYEKALAQSHADQAAGKPMKEIRHYAGQGVGSGLVRVKDGAIAMLQTFIDGE